MIDFENFLKKNLKKELSLEQLLAAWQHDLIMQCTLGAERIAFYFMSFITLQKLPYPLQANCTQVCAIKYQYTWLLVDRKELSLFESGSWLCNYLGIRYTPYVIGHTGPFIHILDIMRF